VKNGKLIESESKELKGSYSPVEGISFNNDKVALFSLSNGVYSYSWEGAELKELVKREEVIFIYN
jgi:hypothetical protein